MISKPLVSKAVGSLIARGYIEGERDKEDKRCIHLKILPKGRPIVDEVKAAWDKYLSVLMSGITEDELASLYETISKISNNADIHLNNNYSDMD